MNTRKNPTNAKKHRTSLQKTQKEDPRNFQY